MPTSNQLLSRVMVRTEVSLGNLMWKNSSDPGVVAYPNDNRITTWLEYKTYIATTGAFQYGDVYCPEYSILLYYAVILPTPTLTQVFNNTFCDGGTPSSPVYSINVNWNIFSGYTVRCYLDGTYTGVSANSTVGNMDVIAYSGTVRVTLRTFDGTNISGVSNFIDVSLSNPGC